MSKLCSALLQDAFLGESLQFAPSHNSNECLTYMLNISKVTCKPLSEVIGHRMMALKAEMESEVNILGVLGRLGLSESESMMVCDGCGGLSGVARASFEDLMDLNLPRVTMDKLMRLLHMRNSS